MPREAIEKCRGCFVEICYTTCPRYLLLLEAAEFWRWWAVSSPGDHRVKEYLQPMPAPAAKGGGSKSGKRRKNKKITDLREYVLS